MVLLVAATEPELCDHQGLVCGVGPVEAAVTTARAIEVERPSAVVHVGVAGGRELVPGTLVVGTEAVYADIAAAITVVSRVEPDAALLAAVRGALPEARALPIATSASVARTGRDFHVEAMEGFAVLRACALARVPAIEMRAVSNAIGEEDRSRWEISRALEVLAAAIPRLLSALPQ